VADFNSAFGTCFSDEKCNTVGGLVLNHLGRVPQVNETIVIEGVSFLVLRADSRRIYTLVVAGRQATGNPE
jgi:magnesium and cobalt transporter